MPLSHHVHRLRHLLCCPPPSRVTGVETDRGSIETDIVVNAGGMYAREIGALAGVGGTPSVIGTRRPGTAAGGYAAYWEGSRLAVENP